MNKVVSDDKARKEENAHNKSHGSSLVASSHKGNTKTVSVFAIILFISVYISTRWCNTSVFTGHYIWKFGNNSISVKPPGRNFKYSLHCTEGNMSQTCSVTRPTTFPSEPSTETCPEYFRWIYEDLRPWTDVGITRELLERAKVAAFIRITVVDGRVYIEKYKRVFQTRDVFTIWGILQLLSMYPGKVPDLDLMFSCGDRPAMKKRYFQGRNPTTPQPLFHYCGDDETFDIVFPDWSFWGWPEINIKPWNALRKDLKEGNNRTKWMDRVPYAYWKGNIKPGLARHELSKCINTSEQDWNARIYDIDWRQEIHSGFGSSDLASQCTHRYKIYTEGVTWSVSEKYILACDSVTLLANPQYYDFFTRSLRPLVHYWPLKIMDMCPSIKFVTDWFNNHTIQAQEIGKAGSSFVQENLKMKFVYDYMFHLLSMYAKLLKYKPTVPPGAIEFCPENMVCPVQGLEKDFKIESMVKSPSDTGPCIMPPPYNSEELKGVIEKKDLAMKLVETWEMSGNVGEDIVENNLHAK